MQTNSLIFNLVLELRRWKKQITKLLVTLISTAILCLLANTSLELLALFEGMSPSWSTSKHKIVTIGNVTETKTLNGVNRVVADTVEKNASVNAVATTILQPIVLAHPTFSIPRLNAVFYDNDFVGLFEPLELEQNQNGVWITHNTWISKFDGADLKKIGRLYHQRDDSGFQIIGVLPESYDKFGVNQVDIYLHQSHYRKLTPFLNDFMIDRFVRSAPVYIVFASVDKTFDSIAIEEQLNTESSNVKGMSFVSSPGKVSIINGFNLSPSYLDTLLSKWKLLVFLILGLSSVVAINLYSLFASHSTLHAREINIMKTLGGKSSLHFESQLLSAVGMIFTLIVLVFVLLYPVTMFLDKTLLSPLSENRIDKFSIKNLAMILSVPISFILASAIMTSNVSDRVHFYRSVGSSVSRLHKNIISTFQTLQYATSILVLATLILVSYYMKTNSNSHSNINELLTLDVSSKGIEGSLNLLNNNAEKRGIAISLDEFNSQKLSQLVDSRLPANTGVLINYISDNYFNIVLGDKRSYFEDNGVVINQALYNLLIKAGPVLGKPLNFGSVVGDLPVIGVIGNLPHNGRHHAPMPAAYLSISQLTGSFSGSFQVYINPNELDTKQDWLVKWLDLNAVKYRLSLPKNLNQKIDTNDKEVTGIFVFAAFVSFIMCMAIFINLFYDAKTTLVTEKQDFGTLLAIGAPINKLVFRVLAKQFYIINICYIGLVAAIVFYPNVTVGNLTLSFPLLFLSVSLSNLTLLTISLLSVSIPVTHFNQTSIYSKLRS